VIIGGLLLATLVTLVAIPAAYVLLRRPPASTETDR
jgi:multidrug efflux pump subunit AcrB